MHLMEGEVEPDTEIVEVRVDGKTYSEAYKHQARAVSIQDMTSVEILTEKREVLATRFMEDAPLYIEHLKKGFYASADLLRDFEREEEGHKMLAQSSETLKAFLDHIKNVARYVPAPDSQTVKAEVKEFVEKLNGLAEEIIVGQEETDSMLVADLIEYELIPLLDEWKERFKDSVKKGG